MLQVVNAFTSAERCIAIAHVAEKYDQSVFARQERNAGPPKVIARYPMVIGDKSALDFGWSQGAFPFNHFNHTVKQTSYRSLF
jgi:hypothetical protein